ncbi:MAG: CRISPR-associated endonuclease Cas2 [Verrucomicrobiae bacterium]|nr:CRISPR-associated endonuclease Cas2 [Verrucomicrobiae bacterium]
MDTDKFKMGWLIVAFDLPVKTPEERKRYTDFRKWLLKDGYQMLQYSVYIRPCVTYARQLTHIDRLRKSVPDEGHVRAIFVTRSQWEKSFIINGRPAKVQSPEGMPEQIMLW